jgi:uncharacterized protein (DUF2141 family)
MNRRLFGLIWALLPSLASADALTIRVNGVPDDSGKLMLAVLGSEAAFTAGDPAPVASILMPARPGTAALTLHDLPPGEYGVRVMHDRNGNDVLDTNLVGMPTEPWGFSNDAAGSFGPPVWKDVKFDLNGTTDITINLNR